MRSFRPHLLTYRKYVGFGGGAESSHPKISHHSCEVPWQQSGGVIFEEMNVDTIDFHSRNFYESARFKMFASLMLFSTSMMCLGMVSTSGTTAETNKLTADINENDDIRMKVAGAYGFSTFLWMVGCVLTAAAGVMTNPKLYGTHNEKNTLSDPIQISGPYTSKSSD